MNTKNMLDTHALHEQWIPMLEIAAREVFELMLGCHLAPASADVELPANVTSMVGLAGQLCGVLSIRCSEESATTMASRMLGVEPDKVGADLADALGDVVGVHEQRGLLAARGVARRLRDEVGDESDGRFLVDALDGHLRVGALG